MTPGLGNAVALDKDGVPYVSYFIFPAKPVPGAIPIPRPLGAPFITTGGDKPKDGAAVGVASVSSDGIWTRGAAAQVIDSPTGIIVPYDPDTVDGLVGATADNTNGTDIAIDANGGKHVVWAGRDGIWYATGTASFKGSATAIETWKPPLTHSGPLGRPSVTVNDSGQPLVAYAIDTRQGTGHPRRHHERHQVDHPDRGHDRLVSRLPPVGSRADRRRRRGSARRLRRRCGRAP